MDTISLRKRRLAPGGADSDGGRKGPAGPDELWGDGESPHRATPAGGFESL